MMVLRKSSISKLRSTALQNIPMVFRVQKIESFLAKAINTVCTRYTGNGIYILSPDHFASSAAPCEFLVVPGSKCLQLQREGVHDQRIL